MTNEAASQTKERSFGSLTHLYGSQKSKKPGVLVCATNLKDRELLHKVQRPTGAGSRRWCGSTNWLAALSPCVRRQ